MVTPMDLFARLLVLLCIVAGCFAVIALVWLATLVFAFLLL